MSVHMITYADVQTDIFQLNKYGHIPNAEIDFNFDKIDFACALATKYGQLKEYQVEDTPTYCKVPLSTDISSFPFYIGAQPYEGDLSAFPQDACHYTPLLEYHCEMLTGWFRTALDEQCFDGKQHTIPCEPYEHTDFNVTFPANEDLYRSLKYEIQNDSFLSGHVHGSLLFFDIDMVGKYVNLIRPAIGDLVAIDFPSDSSKEIYEITDCFDKQLTQDGISPLLHNYIWKCKAKRYVNAHEDNAPANEADERVEEHEMYDYLVDGIVTDQISMYDTLSGDIKEDSAYGGYDSVIKTYDNQIVRPSQEAYDYVDDGTGIDLMKFKMGSKLITNGFDLIFIDNTNAAYNITVNSIKTPSDACVFEQDLRWLKATDNQIVFVNVEGESTAIAMNGRATKGELEICLNSLYDKTLDVGKPMNGQEQNFFKFKGTRSYLWSDGKHLFAKLASSKDLHFIV